MAQMSANPGRGQLTDWLTHVQGQWRIALFCFCIRPNSAIHCCFPGCKNKQPIIRPNWDLWHIRKTVRRLSARADILKMGQRPQNLLFFCKTAVAVEGSRITVQINSVFNIRDIFAIKKSLSERASELKCTARCPSHASTGFFSIELQDDVSIARTFRLCFSADLNYALFRCVHARTHVTNCT